MNNCSQLYDLNVVGPGSKIEPFQFAIIFVDKLLANIQKFPPEAQKIIRDYAKESLK